MEVDDISPDGAKTDESEIQAEEKIAAAYEQQRRSSKG